MQEGLDNILQQFKEDESVKYSPNRGARAKSKLTKTIKLLLDNEELNDITLAVILDAQRSRDRYTKFDTMNFVFKQLEPYMK